MESASRPIRDEQVVAEDPPAEHAAAARAARPSSPSAAASASRLGLDARRARARRRAAPSRRRSAGVSSPRPHEPNRTTEAPPGQRQRRAAPRALRRDRARGARAGREQVRQLAPSRSSAPAGSIVTRGAIRPRTPRHGRSGSGASRIQGTSGQRRSSSRVARLVLDGQRHVAARLVERGDVQVAQPPGERVQQPLAGLHRRVDRQHVRDVEAEARPRAAPRSTARARRPCARWACARPCSPARGTSRAARYARGSSIASGCTTIPSTSGASLREPPHELGLRHPQVLHGRVHAQVAERQLGLRGQVRLQPRQLVLRQRRELGRERRRLQRLGDHRRPVAAAVGHVARRRARAGGAGRRRRILRAARGPWNPRGYGAGRTRSGSSPHLRDRATRQRRLGGERGSHPRRLLPTRACSSSVIASLDAELDRCPVDVERVGHSHLPHPAPLTSATRNAPGHTERDPRASSCLATVRRCTSSGPSTSRSVRAAA